MPTQTDPLTFSYRLQWLDQHQASDLALNTASRRGFVMDTDDHLYVLDFTAGKIDPALLNAERVPNVVVTLAGGAAKVLDARAMKNSETGGWRAFFKLDVPAETKLLELTCELQDKNKKVVSERWMYQWRK
jgi:glucans biosynthesis protein